MEKLKKLLSEKKYDDALSYLKNQHLDKPIKYYNEGYVHYQKKEFALARYKLEKAKYGGLYSENYNEAVASVKESLDIKVIEDSYPIQDKILLEVSGLSTDVYLALVSFFLLVTLVGIIKAKKILTSFGSLLTIISFSLGLFVFNLDLKVNIKENIVFEGPSKMFEQIQILPRGIKFITVKKDNKWEYIGYPEFLRGWVYKSEAKSL